MHQDLHADYRSHVIRNRRKSILKKIVSAMGCLVVFCTTYALILPAITMENTAYCGVEEHTHTEACYHQTSEKVLVCSADHFEIHTHDAGCYGENGVILCGMADYIVHSHDDSCYDSDGQLVCSLPEHSAHVHGDACYISGETQEPVLHVHSETCYTPERGELVCTQEEREGHAHGDGCYAASQDLTCTLEENHIHGGSCYTYPLQCTQSTDPHVHGSDCYSTGNLLCSTEEGHFHGDSCYEAILSCNSSEEGHEHGDSCYSNNLICSVPENHVHGGSCYESIVVCGVEAGQAHAHGAECYSTQPELICTAAENHIHESACYRQELVCSLPEDPGHTHEDGCYESIDVLTCGLEAGEPEPTEPAEPVLVCTEPVAQEHVHADACFVEAEPEFVTRCGNTAEDHIHTPECYEKSCGLTEHTHTMACWSDPEADVESPAVWEATFADVELTGNWNEDVIAIAETQLGYTESTRNYTVWEDESVHGYTRYGAWYGVPHGDWCGMFVSFCIYYADVKGMPLNYGVRPWIEELTDLELYHVAEEYEPKTGDLIFYDWEGDDLSDHVGLVVEIIPETEQEPAKLKAIEGNSANCVQYVYYDLDDPRLLGYSELPENSELYFCGYSTHVHNEYCDDDCATAEHIHEEACMAEPVTYYCDLSEHTHSEECLDEEGNPICGLTEHVHDDACLIESVIYYCGLEEHTHGETCYNEEGELVCELTEHTHTEECTVVPPTYYCGLEEHTHGEACYNEAGELVCELTEHTHTEECTVVPPTYYCGLEEHTHGEACYNEAGELVCELTEHTHTEECTVELPTYYCGLEEHTHGEACYNEAGELVCELTEHTHTEECTVAPPVYYCGKEEHVHTTDCYADGNLICTKETHVHTELCLVEIIYYCGQEAHTHSATCYDAEGNLICTLEEHVHTEACTVAPVYYCGREEHTHSDGCYDAEGNLICPLSEHTHTEECKIAPEYLCGLEAHVHGESCYDAEGNLICTIPEHTHTALCMGYTCGLEAHIHGSGCYDTEGNLTCGLPEHVHDTLCDNYICGKIPHTHGTACYDAEGNLICDREEHTHSAECLAFKLSYEDEKITVSLTITGVEELPEDLQLKVWPVAQENDPAAYGSMSDAVRERMTNDERFVSNVGIYEMQLLQAEEVYTLPENAVVDVDVKFAEPLFSREEVAVSESMETFTLTPDPDREYKYEEEPEVEEPEQEEPEERPSNVVSGVPVSVSPRKSGPIQAVPLVLSSWKDSFVRSHVAYALEDLPDASEPDGKDDQADDPEDTLAPDDTQSGKTPAYNAEAADGDDITNTNVGITGVSFRSTSVGAFAVALTSETVQGDYWLRVNNTNELTSGGTYMIISSDGNYALSSGTSNYAAVQIHAVRGNEQYFTISNADNNSLRWTITSSNRSYTVHNAANRRYLQIEDNNLLSYTDCTVSLSSNTYSNEGDGPFWIFSNGSRRMYNEGSAFKSSTNVNNSYKTRQTQNMLIFKLVNTTLTIPSDVVGSTNNNTTTPGNVPDPNAYQAFINPGQLQVGINGTAVTDEEGSVIGSYYSDTPTSDIEREYRINTGNQKADFEAHHANDGKVLTDKSVIYGDDAYNAFANYDPNTFGVTLSTMGQAYQLPQQDLVKIPVDVVFVLDVSGSMQDKNRITNLVSAVNKSMKQIMDANPANRVGIAVYSSGSAEVLPLDRYTAEVNNNVTEYINATSEGIVTDASLRNSAGSNDYANIGSNFGFDKKGTFTQAGIASGYNIFDDIPVGVHNNTGTQYTVTIGEGEAQRTHTVDRQPVMVLVSDGEPTHCTNVYNDPLNGPYYGNGLSNANPGSQDCNAMGVMGYYTVLTANYFKQMIGVHYDNPALFYTIGMGIAETGTLTVASDAEQDGYKRAVLNPAVINADSTKEAVRYADATLNMMRAFLDEEPGTDYDDDYITVGRNNDACGSWVYDLNADVPVLKNHPYKSDYAYADEAYFGELDETQLETIFNTILTNSLKTNPYGFILYKSRSSVELVDNIGEGMEIKGLQNNPDGSVNALAPQLLYGSRRYSPLAVTSTTANGVTTTTIQYSTGTNPVIYTDPLIPNKSVDLANIKVTVTTDASGNQTVKMFVPDTALPIYLPDSTQSFYYEALPVRLIYQVGLTEASQQAVLNLRNTGGELTFYANRWDSGQVASSVLLPHEENPYYFAFERDSATGEVIKGTIKIRDNLEHHEDKLENITGTYDDTVSCTIEEYETTVTNTHLLGNNGKLVFAADVMEIPVEKTWTEGIPADEMPAEVEVTLYQVTPATEEGKNPTATAFRTGKITKAENGSWAYTFEKLPIPDDTWYYAIAETPIEGFDVTYPNGEIITVTIPDGKDENGQEKTRNIQVVKVKDSTAEDGTVTADAVSVKNNYLWKYELPKTGGSGTPPYHALGMTLIAVACALYIKQKKSKKERGYV